MTDRLPALPIDPDELAALAARYARPRHERWAPVPPDLDDAIAADTALADAARWARVEMVNDVIQRLGPLLPAPLLPCYTSALLRVPRERFVLPEDIGGSALDHPLPLDAEGLATVSAPHAYLLTYDLLDLDEGDQLLELGTGTGYGAAIAREIVGPEGRVVSIEIDPHLAARARRVLGLLEGFAGPRRIVLLEGDARALAPSVLRELPWSPPLKVAVTYALPAVPGWLVELLPEGGRLVAPVASGARAEAQELLLWDKRGGAARQSGHGAVRYVAERR